MYVSRGPQPRLCTSATISSVNRIIVSIGMTGGAGSMALLTNVYKHKDHNWAINRIGESAVRT